MRALRRIQTYFVLLREIFLCFPSIRELSAVATISPSLALSDIVLLPSDRAALSVCCYRGGQGFLTMGRLGTPSWTRRLVTRWMVDGCLLKSWMLVQWGVGQIGRTNEWMGGSTNVAIWHSISPCLCPYSDRSHSLQQNCQDNRYDLTSFLCLSLHWNYGRKDDQIGQGQGRVG